MTTKTRRNNYGNGRHPNDSGGRDQPLPQEHSIPLPAKLPGEPEAILSAENTAGRLKASMYPCHHCGNYGPWEGVRCLICGS